MPSHPPRPARTEPTVRRTLMVVALGLAGVAAMAAPAAADPAGPTHYRSSVTGVVAADGEAPSVDVEVLGGDAFLVVRADPGTFVEVPGYDGEPYVRIDPDGVVHVNQLSPARWLNDARYGTEDIEVPPHADAAAPPQWTLAARSGEYAWHDHRIHFMSPALPPQVDTGAGTVQPIWDWTVPLEVDGREVTVSGELAWLPGPGPIMPFGLAAVAALVVLAVVLRWPAAAQALALAGALATGVVGVVTLREVPAGADGEPALVMLPALTVGLLAVGATLRRRRDVRRGGLVAFTAGIPLLIWGVLQSGALTRPIVPGPLPVETLRALVAIALAVGIASVTASVRAIVAATSRDDTPTSAAD